MIRLSVIGFFLFLLPFLGSGADMQRPPSLPPPFRQLFDLPQFSHLNTAESEFYLSEEEKMIIALCNLARFDGQLFIREIIIPSSADTTKPNVQALMSRLRQSRNIPPLMPAYSLHKTASQHARDMGVSGKTGHISSSGLSFGERMAAVFPDPKGFAENYYAGNGELIDVVIGLMAGPEPAAMSNTATGTLSEYSVNYTDNILSPEMQFAGISTQAHRKSCSNTVLNLGRKPKTHPGPGIKHPKTEIYFMDCPKGRDHDLKKKNPFSFGNLFSRDN
jgi:hypothetical protein